MYSKGSITAVATLAVLTFGASVNAWAEILPTDHGMDIQAVASSSSDIVLISGNTVKQETIQIQIWSPLNNLVKIDQLLPAEDGTYSTNFNVSGLTEDGDYTIIANQGNSDLYELEVKVNVVDGVAMDTLAIESNFERSFSAVGTELFMGGSIDLVADAMEGSDTIYISGQTDTTNQDVTLTVTAPNGKVVSVSQIDVSSSDGLFSADIVIGGPMWSQDGMYTVTAEQDISDYSTSVTVGIEDGLVVPEFGTIAALILAVSIIAIVTLSARSRLSLAPRF